MGSTEAARRAGTRQAMTAANAIVTETQNVLAGSPAYGPVTQTDLTRAIAARLAAVLKSTSSRLRLKIAPNPDNAKALAQLDRRDATLAVLRTDAKVPARARAIAILEHDVVLVLSPGGKKIKSLPELKKKKIAVVGDGESSVNFVRNARSQPQKAHFWAGAGLDLGKTPRRKPAGAFFEGAPYLDYPPNSEAQPSPTGTR